MSVASPESCWPDRVPLKEVDNLLRCGICFDYFNIAVIIPQCSHNYCSLCIRKSLSYKAQCPTCCVAATEPDLKNNRILDELVKTFCSARRRLFQAVLDAPSISPPALFTKKFPVEGHVLSSSDGFALDQEKQFPDTLLVKENICTPIRYVKPPARKSEHIRIKQEENLPGSEGGHETVSESAASIHPFADTGNPVTPSTSATKVVTKVECPVCGVPVQEQHINKHLDGCLTRDEKKDSLRSSGHKRKFLPKLVYNLLSDRDLRKRLKEHGLSTQGTKQQLIKRHQEFVHMYNAQCDALNPKSAAEIVKELENNEKIRAQLESCKPEEHSMMFTKHQTENEIDEIHRDYRKKHKAEFQLLIDRMNKQKKKVTKIKIEKGRLEQEEAIAKEVPMETGDNLNVGEHTDQDSFTDCSLKTKALDYVRSQSLDTSEVRELVPASSFPSSESSNSSSSDILRDLEIAGMRSGLSDNNSFSDVNMTKQKSRRSRSTPFLSRSKRRKK